MTEIPKWLISDQIITNSFRNLSIERGVGFQRIIFFFIASMSMPLAFLLSNLVLAIYKVRNRNVNKEFSLKDFLIGNDYETDYFYSKRILKNKGKKFEQFNQFDPSNFVNNDIGFFDYQIILIEACKDLLKITKVVGANAKFLIFISSLRNILFYVIYRTFFRYYKKRGVSDIHLISMPLNLMCAIEKEGLNCNVYLHGLSVKVLPDQVPTLTKLFLFSRDEKDYFSKFVPIEKIQIYDTNKIKDHNNVAIILLRQTLKFDEKSDDKMNMVDIEAVKTFADKNNLELYFKIHPKTDKNKINTLNKILKIEENQLLLNRTPVVENILALKPKIIFSWFSSGLAESLNYDVLPVAIEEKSKSKKINELSNFDYKKRSLSFYDQTKILKDAIQDKNQFRETINLLKNND